MELSDYLAIARKRWASILALSALGVVVAVTASLLATPVYTATTQLYVSVQGGSSTNDMLQGANFTRQQVSSYTKLVTSPLVLSPVVDDLALETRASELAENVSSDSPPNSSLVNINVSDSSPAIAAALADAIAVEFRDVVAELEKPTDGSPSSVKLTVVRNAEVPVSPSSPNTKLNLILGLLAGLALGVGLAVLRETLDTRVRSEAAVGQVTELSVVGVIPHDDASESRPLIVQSDPHSPRAEAFRRLRTNVQFLNVGGRPDSIVITSSLPGEGKSTTTINLAIALAEAGTSVVLVDADLRRPSVAKYLGIEGGAGLTTVLIGRVAVADVIQTWGNGNLHVIPSGQVPPNPSELLGSQAMSELLAELTDQYDIVLIDTPPLLPVTDAAVLAKCAGGVLVVVGAGKVHRNQLSEALGALDTVDAHTLGVVVNREPRKNLDAYSYYRYEPDEAQRASVGMPRVKNATRRNASTASGAQSPSVSRAENAAPSVTGAAFPPSPAWPTTSDRKGEPRERSDLPPQHLRRGR